MGYWRTLPVLDQPAGRAALGVGPDETAIGLIHLGYPRVGVSPSSTRAPVAQLATFLD